MSVTFKTIWRLSPIVIIEVHIIGHGTNLVRDLLVARPLEVEVAEDRNGDVGVLLVWRI